MVFHHAFMAGLVLPLSVASAAASAQANPSQPLLRSLGGASQITEEVANPVAPVPAVLYRSVFVDTPSGVETEEVDWKKANAEVGQFRRGHVDILQWENKQEPKR